MGIDDGFDWSQLPGYSTDPAAGMPDWSNVTGALPTDYSNLPGFGTDPSSGINGVIQGNGIQDDPGGNISRLLQTLKGKGVSDNSLSKLASTLGAFSSGAKANRVVQGTFTQKYDQLMLDAEKQRNSTESDAMKKLAQTSYIMGGGSKFKPPSLTLNGKSYQTPDLGYGPSPSSAAQISGATSLQGQLGARLMPGGTYTPQPLSDYAKPGAAENAATDAASISSGIGTFFGANAPGGSNTELPGGSNAPGGQSGGNGVVSDIAKGAGMVGSVASLASKFAHPAASAATSGAAAGAVGAGSTMSSLLSKAVPVAGAITGAYGLAKNQSVGSDTLAGAGAGASIGSFGGPIGTAVGAGVGALVGALRGAFSVTAKEKGGRDAQAQIAQNLGKLATPQQVVDSKKAGWPDPNQALALIVMRDALTKQGLPPAQAETQAEASMRSIWDAERSGAGAVNQAGNSITSMLGRG